MKDKRRQIIDAAHQLFIEQGFTNTSIQSILDEAEVAKGTFYKYFTSKNECLLAILESITEEIDQERRKIALGKDAADKEVFVSQLAVRMKIMRKHNLMPLFESISFTKDKELKAYLDKQARNELNWLSKRLRQLHPEEAAPLSLDYAAMLTGIIFQMMQVWKLGSDKEIELERFIHYGLNRIELMAAEQLDKDAPLLPNNWLGLQEEKTGDKEKLIKQLEDLYQEIKTEGTKKQIDLILFLIAELQTEEPRGFLIESVLHSLEQSFSGTEVEIKSLVQRLWREI